MSGDVVRRAVLGAVTAELDGDQELAVDTLTDAVGECGSGEVLGCLLAYTCNVVKLLAMTWSTTPGEAWAAVLKAERRTRGYE